MLIVVEQKKIELILKKTFSLEKKMNFAFVTKQIDYLVDFYSKSNRLSFSIFTVIVIDIIATP
jgi:hypothetical protein